MLTLFWVDIIILTYCKQFDNFKKKTKYSGFFYFKVAIIILMTIDLIIFIILPGVESRPIRPFRVLRCCKYVNMQLYPYYSILKLENP